MRLRWGEAYRFLGYDDSELDEDEKGVRYVPTGVRVVKAGELATVDDAPEPMPGEGGDFFDEAGDEEGGAEQTAPADDE